MGKKQEANMNGQTPSPEQNNSTVLEAAATSAAKHHNSLAVFIAAVGAGQIVFASRSVEQGAELSGCQQQHCPEQCRLHRARPARRKIAATGSGIQEFPESDEFGVGDIRMVGLALFLCSR